MDFCLIYEGPLKSNAGPREKHAIRKLMHTQLADLWEKHPVLSIRKHHVHKASEWFGEYSKHDPSFFAEPDTTELESLARKYGKFGFRFVPLVNTYTDVSPGSVGEETHSIVCRPSRATIDKLLGFPPPKKPSPQPHSSPPTPGGGRRKP
jgi:hypothetical protein